MGKKAPDPTPPRITANAQTSANIHSAIANAFLNTVDHEDPSGSVKTRKTGSQTLYDPYSQKSYEIPTFTRYTELSGIQKDIRDQTDQSRLNLARIGKQQSDKIGKILGEDLQYDQIFAEDKSDQIVSPVLQYAQTLPNFDFGSENDFSQERNRIENALVERMRPQQEREFERLESRLASQGIRMGSESYSDAMADHYRSAHDRQLAAILAAGKEHSALHRMQQAQTNARNALEQDAFNARMQQVAQANQAKIAKANMDMKLLEAENALRKQRLQEKISISNDPINKITALMSGSQVSMPRFSSHRIAEIPTTNVAQIVAQHDSNAIKSANADSTLRQDLLDGWLKSDRRTKEQIAPVGKTLDGQTVYQFRYKSGGPIRMGLMADEVADRYPQAVTSVRGIQGVHYGRALEKARILGQKLSETAL